MNTSAIRQPYARSRDPSSPRVIPAILVIYACMLPRELTFEIAGVAFQPFRVALTLMLPVAVVLAAQQKMRPSYVDLLIVFASVWAFIALWVVVSIDAALITGLSDGLNLAFAYFIGRASIRTSRDFQRVFVGVLPGLLFCSVILAVESIGHQNLLRPFVAQLLGLPSINEPYSVRIGLMRARGPFPHAILGGVFLASFLPIVWYMANKKTTRVLGLLAVAGFFFSVSSTGFLGIIVASGLMITAYFHRVSGLPIFQSAVGGTLAMLLFIEVFSQSGAISFIVRRLTFSSGTGYYRMLIWEYAGADALNNPIFGIGLRTYIRPAWMVAASIDAHWLLVTVRYGFPFGVAVLLAMIAGVVMSLRGVWSPYPLDQRAGYAIGFSLIATIFTGLSVFLWEGMGAWMTLLNGMAVTFGQQMAMAVRSQEPSPRQVTSQLQPA